MGRAVLLLTLVVACNDPARQVPGDGDIIGEDDASDGSTDDAASPAAFSATPTALTFTALVGTTAQASAVFANTGGTASGALSLALGGTTAPFMIGATTCTGTLAAGETCTVRVDYTASAASTSNGSLTLSDGATSVIVSLTGSGSNTAGLTATPTLRDFMTAAIGTTSAPFTVTIKNVGTAATAALTVAVQGGNSGDFVLAANQCAGAVVAPQATCTFSAAFKPTAIGARAATVKVTDATSGATTSVTLVGNGITQPGGMVFTPSAFDFGIVNVGDSAFAQQFTLTNNGGSTSGSISTSTSGTNVGDFLKMADNCIGHTLGPGATCTLFVAFEPGAAGERTARVTAVATTGGTASADLSGTGN